MEVENSTTDKDAVEINKWDPLDKIETTWQISIKQKLQYVRQKLRFG